MPADASARVEMTDSAPPHLAARSLVAGYDGIAVLREIDLELPRGGFGLILGANGAGKTTTLRAIMGLASVMSGDLELDGERSVDRSTAALVASGVAMVPEGRQLFAGLTVEENLLAGGLVGRGRSRRDERLGRVFDYFPVLAKRLSQTAGTLSGGEQQMLAIGRALMSGPSLLLVDEASLGLAPIMVQTLLELLARINADGVTVLAVEQNLAAVEHADHVLVLEQGRATLSGSIEEVGDRLAEEVTGAYLGHVDQGGDT